tara:strand:+ start:2123 stop:4366 length:2244 start_codon:yes stop_codon:yes gene_type:complete
MQKVRIPLTNFAFGEVSPSLYSRTDSPVYNQSAQRVKNFFIRSEGGVVKRSGLQKIFQFDTTVDETKVQQCRLLPFIFSDDERYIISLENAKVRVFQINPVNGAVSLIQTITSDINSAALKFDDEFLHEYTYAQAGDVMFIAHQTFAPQQIVRTSLTTFQIEGFQFDQKSDNKQVYQPYFSFQGAGVTLDPSASSGSGVTLTTSAAYWDTTSPSKHIGTTVRYNGQEIEITGVTSSTVATGDILDSLKIKLSPDSLRTNNGSNIVEVTLVNHGMTIGNSITFSDCDTVGGISISNLNGSRTVAGIISDDVFTFTAGGSANDSALGGGTPSVTTHAPTTSWEEQSYSALRGFPAAVTFHENRLVFAGTLGQPDSIWFSKIASYYNFDVGEAKDNESIQLTAAIGEIQQIRHIVSNRDLQIFAASAEMFVPAFQNQPITPTNAQVRRQTPFGSGFTRPQILDGATLFVQKGGQIVREYLFSDSEAAYVANPISTISSHLIKSPIEMNTLYGALSRSESYVFIVNEDGTMSVFNSNRAEQRAGWVEFVTNGKFHSTVTIDDRVFANVEYDLGDGTKKIILCEFDSTFNLDMAKTYTGSNGVFNVSADFNNGAVLRVVNGNNYIGEFTVSGGNIDVSSVDASLSSAEIGFNFDVELTTNPIDAQVNNGPITGIPRGLGTVYLDLNNTLAVKVNETAMIIRNVTDDLSQQLAPFTGKKEFRLLGYNADPQITITQDAPLDLQVNGLVAELIF